MKKLASALLAGLMTVSLVACGGQQETKPKEQEGQEKAAEQKRIHRDQVFSRNCS